MIIFIFLKIYIFTIYKMHKKFYLMEVKNILIRMYIYNFYYKHLQKFTKVTYYIKIT